MYLPKLREIKEALGSLFSKPYTTKFPKESFIPEKEYRGFPKYYKEFCVGCGTCAQVCPATAIEISIDKERSLKILKINYASCINCGQCEEHCITKEGIKITNEYSFSYMDKSDPNIYNQIEKETISCEICNEPFATIDHLEWILKRLGAKAYAHPNFLIHIQKQFSEVAIANPKPKIRREDQIKVLCPKCRHKVVVEDEFYAFNRQII